MTFAYAMTVGLALVAAAVVRLVIIGHKPDSKPLTNWQTTCLIVVIIVVLLAPYAAELSFNDLFNFKAK